MNRLSEKHEMILSQELNDTSGVVEIVCHTNQNDDSKNLRVRQRIENLMKRKKYSMKKEEDKELIIVNQEVEEYPITDSNTHKIIDIWTTKNPENEIEIQMSEASSDYLNSEPLEIFNTIISDDVIKTIINYTNKRIDVEKLISIDLYYWKKYCKIFNDLYIEIMKYKNIKQFIHQSSNVDLIKQMNDSLTNQKNLKKCFNTIIKSPKEYIMNYCIDIYHIEVLYGFKDNDKECEKFLKYFNKIDEIHNNEPSPRHISQITDKELRYYIGVIIYCGGCGYSNIREAFKNDNILKYHVFSNRRFNEIARCLRFDSYDERKFDDVLSPVQFIIDTVRNGIKSIYRPSNMFTIDEHIIPFTGVFKYSVTIKDKPHSKGLRMDCLNDCQNGYLYNFRIYAKTGNSENNDEENQNDERNEMKEENNNNYEFVNQTQMIQIINETQQMDGATNNENKMKKRKKQQMKSNEKKSNYSKPSSKIIIPKSTKYNYQYSMPNGEIAKTVKFLLNEFEMKPIQQHVNRIIIGMDNYYTTTEVINYLINSDIGFCGTVRVLRSYIPEKLKQLNLPLYQSVQISKENVSMTNYKAKINKNVFIISNLIQQFKRSKGDKRKPEMVLLYNKLKGATDRYDHLIEVCDIRRKSNRYQLAVFYDMMNVIVTDIFIIKRMKDDKLNHRQFVVNLGLKLLGVDNCENIPKLCCYTIPENTNCKLTNNFFIMRTTYPHGIQHIGHSNCLICNQCSKPIVPNTLKQVIFDFCSKCCEQLSFPENFKVFEKKEKQQKEIDVNDQGLNELENDEKRHLKRKYSD